MTGLSRRQLLGLGLGALAAAPSLRASGASRGRVVVIGGGFGGVTLARTLRHMAPRLAVTLVERRAEYTTCPFSNTVLAGLRALDSLRFDYRALREAGITVVQGKAVAIDADRRRVHLSDGRLIEWDRLVLSPGVQMQWSAIAGYDAEAAQHMPHAWQAGAQTDLLARQLRAMDDGGTVLISVPPAPFRCPPGPYERACLIAHFLQRTRPRSKVLILDANESFSKQALFEEAWDALYPGMIERIPASQTGQLRAVDTRRGILETDFDRFRPAVANVIPPQRAGTIATTAGLDEGLGFCSVDPRSFESTVVPGIHVLGDAALAWGMPKSGFSAASQARACAHALAALFAGEEPAAPVLLNTCYSLAAPDYGFSITAAFRAGSGALETLAGSAGTSPLLADRELRRQEARHASAWYDTATRSMFGTAGGDEA